MAKLRLFDAAKLQVMQEPFYLRATRLKGGRPEPVPLPPKEGFSAVGQGWTKEDVLNLDTWMPSVWGGGGVYTYALTDAQNQTMTWDAPYSMQTYPEKFPQLDMQPQVQQAVAAQQAQQFGASPQFAPMAAPSMPPWMMQAAMSQMPAQQQQPQQQGIVWPGQWPGQQVPPWVAAQQVPPGGQWTPQQGWQMPPWYGPPPPAALTTPRDSETALREQATQEKLRHQEEKHQAQRQADAERHRNEQAALSQKMDQMAATLAQQLAAAAVPRESPELIAMREQVRASTERAEREQERREQERRDRESQTRFETLLASQQQKMDVLAAEMRNSQAAAQQANQVQAIVSLVQQTTTQTAALYSGMQSSLEKVHERSSAQALEMLRSAGQGADNAFKHVSAITDAYGRLTEQAMQMNSGAPGTAEKVIEAVQAASEKGFSTLEQWMASKQAEAVAKEKTKQVEAQSHVMTAQAQAQTAAANAYTAQQQAAAAAGHPAQPAPAQGLNGAVNGAPVNAAAGVANGAPTPVAPGVTGAAAATLVQQNAGTSPVLTSVPATAAPSEMDMLGNVQIVMEYVLRLRDGVKRGGPMHGNAKLVAERMVYAVNMIKSKGLGPVPAVGLFDEGKYDQFIEFLIPATGVTFRDEVEGEMRKLNGESVDEGKEAEAEAEEPETEPEPDDDGEQEPEAPGPVAS